MLNAEVFSNIYTAYAAEVVLPMFYCIVQDFLLYSIHGVWCKLPNQDYVAGIRDYWVEFETLIDMGATQFQLTCQALRSSLQAKETSAL